MASGRFPGKPLAKIRSVSMVGHCFFRSKMSKFLDEVYVATCDQKIYDYAVSIGAKAIMTSDHHQMATDRVAEAARTVEAQTGVQPEIVVNIQGDQPMVFPEMIDAVVAPLLEDPTLECSTMVDHILSQEEFEDPNRIKVIMDLQGNALYFSREPIPSATKFSGDFPKYKHVALTPFRWDLLMKFSELPMTPLETVESIDYNRLLEHGYRIRVVASDIKTETVDTTVDLANVDRMMADDPLLALYAKAAV